MKVYCKKCNIEYDKEELKNQSLSSLVGQKAFMCPKCEGLIFEKNPLIDVFEYGVISSFIRFLFTTPFIDEPFKGLKSITKKNIHLFFTSILASLFMLEISFLIVLLVGKKLSLNSVFIDRCKNILDVQIYDILYMNFSLNELAIYSAVLVINVFFTLLPSAFLIHRISKKIGGSGTLKATLCSYILLLCSFLFYTSIMLGICTSLNLLILFPIIVLIFLLYYVIRTLDILSILYSCSVVDSILLMNFAFIINAIVFYLTFNNNINPIWEWIDLLWPK